MNCQPYQRRARRGSMLTELVVAGGLLVTAMGLVATTLAAGRKLQRIEQERIVAVDELSNQLEQLTALPRESLQAALDKLQPSEWAAEILDEAELSADIVDDAYGARLELQLNWRRLGDDQAGRSPPLTVVGWLSASETETLAEVTSDVF